jgi:hypothetical protein
MSFTIPIPFIVYEKDYFYTPFILLDYFFKNA